MKKTITKSIAMYLLLLIGSSHVNAQTLFKDLNPGNNSSTPEQLTVVNGTMYFITNCAPNYKHQLWKTDGTVANTVLVKDSIIFTNVNDAVYIRGSIGDTLYYSVNSLGISAGTTTYLWKTHGNKPVIVDTLAHANGKYPTDFTVVGNKLFFNMGQNNGRELWVTDGTEAGTKEVIDLAPGFDGVTSQPMVAFNGKVYFQGNTNGANNELFSSDGTAAGTLLVKEINPSTSQFPSSASNPEFLTVFNNMLYCYADNGTTWSIYKTDGTSAGTSVVSSTGFNGNVKIFNNAMYYSVGGSLWKSDGTAAGTTLVMDSAGGVTGMNASHFYTSYMKSLPSPPYYKYYYWESDGTVVGTKRISYNVGSTASFNVINNTMYQARVDSGTNNMAIWSTDGTVAGTTKYINGYMSSTIAVFGNNVYFTNFGSGTGYELWSLTATGVGINETVGTSGSLKIYPNPSSGKIWVSIPSGQLSTTETGEFRITDISGRQVHSKIIANADENITFDLDHLQNGIYFLHGPNGVQKIIISR